VFNPGIRFRQAITPIALAVVSLFVALAVWVAVTNEENPTTDREFPVTIPIDAVGVPEGLAVLSMSPDAVVVTVRATDEAFEDLTAANFTATVDMTGIRDSQSTRNIVVDVEDLDEEVSIVEMRPSTFTRVVLETEASKTVPVQVNRLGTLAQGFVITATTTSPEQATVSGPASSVALVQSADADVNLTGVRSNIQLQYDLTPRDGGGAVQPRVTVQPASAEVRMTVQQLATPQLVPVLARLQGEIARGFNIIDITSDPSAVQVTGPLEVLQTVDAIDTEPIDISGANATITRSIGLQIPEGLEAQRQTVNVTIEIAPAPGSRAITVAPTVINVPPGLNPVFLTTALTVRVSGPTPVLNEITPANIQAIVNVENLPEGDHTLPVQVIVPETVRLDAVEPPEAVIALRP
jgi:YbbR domain-containing protein